jgi:hypothetical protein
LFGLLVGLTLAHVAGVQAGVLPRSIEVHLMMLVLAGACAWVAFPQPDSEGFG